MYPHTHFDWQISYSSFTVAPFLIIRLYFTFPPPSSLFPTPVYWMCAGIESNTKVLLIRNVMCFRIFASLLENKTLWTVGEYFYDECCRFIYLLACLLIIWILLWVFSSIVFLNPPLYILHLCFSKKCWELFSLGIRRRHPGFTHFTFLLALFLASLVPHLESSSCFTFCITWHPF